MRRIFLIAVVLIAESCGAPPPPTACQTQMTVENPLFVFDLGEWGTGADRLTVDTTDAGVVWYASARHQGGRIYLRLHPSIPDGTLPRAVTSNTGCMLSDAFQYRDDADGKLVPGAATITVLDGGQVGAHSLDCQLSRMTFRSPDGGASPLPDRRLTFVF